MEKSLHKWEYLDTEFEITKETGSAGYCLWLYKDGKRVDANDFAHCLKGEIVNLVEEKNHNEQLKEKILSKVRNALERHHRDGRYVYFTFLKEIKELLT